jgi:hypothetical protein
MPNDPKIDLVVKSTSGQFSESYNRSNKAQKVLDEAIKRLGLATGPGVTYVLVREADDRALALSEKLDDLQLTDPDTVVVQTSQAQDG